MVKTAVKSAVDHHFPGGLKTHEIIEASQQVVAGMNYKVTVKLTETASNACRKHQFTIWRKLNGTHEITESNDLGEMH
jgi:Cystatin domain